MSESGALLRLVTLSLLTTLISCTSAEDRHLAAARSAWSWAATATLTSEALDRGAVPRRYAQQILKAGKEVEDQLASQREWSTLSDEIKQSLEGALDQLASSIGKAATRHE